MAVRPADQRTYQRRYPVSRVGSPLAPTVVAVADAAAFGVLLVAAIAIPSVFSIENSDVFVMPKTILAVGLAGVLAPLIAVRWLSGRWSLDEARSKPMLWALLAFVALNLVAAGFATDRQHALIGEKLQFQGLATTLAYAIFLVAAWTTVRSGRRRTLLLWAIAAGAAVAAAYAVIQRLGIDPIWRELSDGRVFSTFGQPNSLAAYFVVTIPLTIALAARRHIVVQIVLTGLVVLEIASLAFTLSRGGFLGAGAATIVLAVVLVARRRLVFSWPGAAMGILAAGILVGSAMAIPQTRRAAGDVVERVTMIDDVQEASASAHLDQWAVGIAIVSDHVLIGAGQDSYVLLFGDYRDQVLPADRARVWEKYRPESPHNHYLAIAGGAGVPALLAYIGVIGIAVARGVRGVRRSRDARTIVVGAAFLAAIAGHLVTDFFMTAEVTGSVLFWVVLGATAALGSSTGPQRAQRGVRVWGSRSRARRFQVS
jgi:O-antigen ligase